MQPCARVQPPRGLQPTRQHLNVVILPSKMVSGHMAGHGPLAYPHPARQSTPVVWPFTGEGLAEIVVVMVWVGISRIIRAHRNARRGRNVSGSRRIIPVDVVRPLVSFLVLIILVKFLRGLIPPKRKLPFSVFEPSSSTRDQSYE